ncbi:MAG: 5'-nucleotidase C-terminal domain-containing protein, partial [Pseudomonadota bacterium]
FNYGLPFLRQAMAGRTYPIVSSNITLSGSQEPLFAPWLILERRFVDEDGQHHDLKLGVFGVCPRQILKWDRHHLEGEVEVADLVEAAGLAMERLRQEGADIIIGLSHSGIVDRTTAWGMENATQAIAKELSPDALIAGHTHKYFPDVSMPITGGIDPHEGTLHGVPTVQPGFWGSHLGVVDLELCLRDTKWHVEGAHSELRRAAQFDQPSTRLAAFTQEAHQRTLSRMQRPIGQTPMPLNTYFAQVAPDIGLELMLRAQEHWARAVLGNSDIPILAAASPMKAGGFTGQDHYVDIPAGPLTQRHASDLYFYPNTLAILRATGAQVREWLERSASQFATISQGARGGPLLCVASPAYDFDVLSGLYAQFDISGPPAFCPETYTPCTGRRVVDLTRNGVPVEPTDQFYLVTSAYRAGGGGGFPLDGMALVEDVPSTTAREALTTYLQEDGTVAPVPKVHWSLAPLASTTAYFDTGPGARRGQVPLPKGLSYLGPGENAFDRYLVRLDALIQG